MKKRAQEAEGETTIVKGIGLNSPEMKALQAKVNELEGTLGSAQDINDNHQRYNGKLQTRLTEVEEDNKKLAKQIQDLNLELKVNGKKFSYSKVGRRKASAYAKRTGKKVTNSKKKKY